MVKSKAIPFLILVMLGLFFVACGKGTQEDETCIETILKQQQDHHISGDVRLDFISEERAGSGRYFFPDDNHEANALFVAQVEDLIYEIRKFVPFDDFRLYIYLTNNRDQMGFRAGHQIAFSDKDFYAFGLLTERLISGSLISAITRNRSVNERLTPSLNYRAIDARPPAIPPFWLVNGIEAMARSNAGLMDTTSDEVVFPENFLFGDLHFFPYSWGNDEHKLAINVAYHFTRYLLDNNYLETLIGMYLNGEKHDADILAQNLFSGFSGQSLDVSTSIRFAENRRFMINVRDELSDINFVFDDIGQQAASTNGLVRNIGYVQDATEFVKNWFAEYIGFDFTIVSHNFYQWYLENEPNRIAVAILGNAALYFEFNEHFGAFPVIEETAHMMEFQTGLRSPENHPWFVFEDGLSGALTYMFDRTHPYSPDHAAFIEEIFISDVSEHFFGASLYSHEYAAFLHFNPQFPELTVTNIHTTKNLI